MPLKSSKKWTNWHAPYWGSLRASLDAASRGIKFSRRFFTVNLVDYYAVVKCDLYR